MYIIMYYDMYVFYMPYLSKYTIPESAVIVLRVFNPRFALKHKHKYLFSYLWVQSTI